MKFNKKSIFTFTGILLVIMAFVFGVSYALKIVENSTINVVTTKSVRVKIVEEYKEPDPLYPTNEVSKIVNVKNTGDLDVLLRVKVQKAWGESRDEDGNLNINNSLSTDNLILNLNDNYWIYDTDGYYYYKGVLSPGKTTLEPLFDSYIIDAEKTGNEYQGMLADILVTSEVIQYSSNAAVDAWGKTYEFFGVDTPDEPDDLGKTYVTYVSPSEEFDIRWTKADLFLNFKDLVPGSARTQVIEVKNEHNKDQEIFLKAEYTEQDSLTENLVNKMLKDYIFITVKNGDTVIYSGPVYGNLENDSDSMKNYISLGNFKSGEIKNLTVTLSVDKTMGNEYQNLLGNIKWTFMTKYTDPMVIVHHYLFGSNIKLSDDVIKNGNYGWVYETEPSSDLLQNYILTGYPDNNPVNYPSNWTGSYIDDVIHVNYYYKLIHADYETSIVKDGDTYIENSNDLVDYNINYKAIVKAYKGKAIVTIVDKLPASLWVDENGISDSILDGGIYNPFDNTITWKFEVDVDTYVNGETTLSYTKHPSLHYNVFGQVLRNVVDGTIDFVETGESNTVSDDHDVNAEEKGKVIVHHYLEGTTTKLAEDVSFGGPIGSEYVTEPVDMDKYELVATPVNATGKITKEDTEVIYYYRLKEPIGENKIFKSGVNKVSDLSEVINYTISYNTKVDNYNGVGVITIVDKLAYDITESLSNFDGGVYDSHNNTITWKINCSSGTDTTYEQSCTDTIIRSISIKYYGLTDDITKIVNKVTGSLSYDGNELTDDDEQETEVKIPALVIVNHYYKDTTHKLADTIIISTYIGEDYETNLAKELLDKGYKFYKVVGVVSGKVNQKEIIVDYYYEKDVTPDNPYTADNIGLYILTMGSSLALFITSLIFIVKDVKKKEN